MNSLGLEEWQGTEAITDHQLNELKSLQASPSIFTSLLNKNSNIIK